MSTVSISDLVMALEDGIPLRDALARSLADDELTVLYWVEKRQGSGRSGWVDLRGHSVAEPTPTPGRSVRIVEENGVRVAAIVHDCWTRGRPHRVFLAGGALIVETQVLRVPAVPLTCAPEA